MVGAALETDVTLGNICRSGCSQKVLLLKQWPPVKIEEQKGHYAWNHASKSKLEGIKF